MKNLEADNHPRFNSETRNHVESWFVRANHPRDPMAIWLKATAYMADGFATASVWCIMFDARYGQVQKFKQTIPIGHAAFRQSELRLKVGIEGCLFQFGRNGTAQGSVSDRDGSCSWNLAWHPRPDMGHPLCLFPTRRMIDGWFPRSKLLTPIPTAQFYGDITWNGRKIPVKAWSGIQGHNWGKEHAWEYAWGHCNFLSEGGFPHTMVEAFSSRIKLFGLKTPRMSSMVIRRENREYRFDRIFDPWRQKASIEWLIWHLSLKGPNGKATLGMMAQPSEMAHLLYENPNETVAHCLNSKLARTELRVEPANGEPFECYSQHGGALEFLSDRMDPRLVTGA